MPGVKRWVLLLSGIASFLIYACAALLLQPTQDHAFIPERSALAAAVSNVVHGASLGEVYSGALDLVPATASSTELFLAQASRDEIGDSKLLPNTAEGMGIGYMLVSDVGFRLLGVHIASVVYTMLALIALSAAAFWVRFSDRRLVVVPLYFGALTVMLVMPLGWEPISVTQIPIGGFRYFSLLAILPAFHLLLELLDRRQLGSSWGGLLAIAAQVVVFLTAVLVRNNAVVLIAAVALGGLFCAWRLRRERAAVWTVVRKAAFMALVGAAFVGILMTLFSREYLSQGRFTEVVWTRVVVSLGMHPAWPFGNLREVYDCRQHIPRGLVDGVEDQNGHCIWLAHVKAHNLPADEFDGTYSRNYEAILRYEFFKIFRSYPREVLETLTIYKVRPMFVTLKSLFTFDLTRVPAALIWLAAAALANLLVLGFLAPLASPGIAGATALFAASTIPPYIVAYAVPWTTADLVCFLLIGLGLALVSVMAWVRRALAPSAP